MLSFIAGTSSTGAFVASSHGGEQIVGAAVDGAREEVRGARRHDHRVRFLGQPM